MSSGNPSLNVPDRDIEDHSPARSSLGSPAYVPNTGSAARDYCTIERTLLSFTRLGLVLFVLSAALILKAQLPNPDEDKEEEEVGGDASIPFGSVYAVVAILAIISGWLGYESDLRGLREERGFVGGFKITEAFVVVVALLLFATCVLLLRADYEVM